MSYFNITTGSFLQIQEFDDLDQPISEPIVIPNGIYSSRFEQNTESIEILSSNLIIAILPLAGIKLDGFPATYLDIAAEISRMSSGSGTQNVNVVNIPAVEVTNQPTVNLANNSVRISDTNGEAVYSNQYHLNTLTNPLLNPQTKQDYLKNLIGTDLGSMLRVSTPTTISSITQNFGKAPLFMDEVTINGGVSVYNSGVTNMTVVSNTQAVIRQSFQFHPYITGKPMEFEFTFNNFQPEENVVKRVGCFHSNTVTPFNLNLDGIYLESSNGEVKVVANNNGAISGEQTQFQWFDPLDGTGLSGITIDWSLFQKLRIEWIYLGGGACARIYLSVLNNVTVTEVLVAQIEHANINISPITRYCCQPIRFEIRSFGGAGTFGAICAGMSINGAEDLVYRNVGIDSGNTASSFSGAGTIYPILTMRIDPALRQKYFDFDNITVLSTSNDDMLVRIIRNPTFTGAALTYNSVPNSGLQFATNNAGANTIVAGSGNTIFAKIVRQGSNFNSEIRNSLRLGSDINGTTIPFSLAITPLSAGLTAFATVNLLEIS